MRDGREESAIEHEVAFHAREPLVAQHRHERLPSLQRELGIAAAFQHEIAVQHAGVERAVEIRGGGPVEFRAEQFQRREGRDELHHGRGVVRPIRLLREKRPVIGHVLDDDGDGIERDARVEEYPRDLAGQRGRGGAGGDEDGERQAHARAARRVTRASTISTVRATSSANSSSVRM